MPDDEQQPKPPASAPESSEGSAPVPTPPSAAKPADPAAAKSPAPARSSVATAAGGGPATPTPPAAHKAPPPPPAMATTPWDDAFTQALKAELGEAVTQFASYRNQQFLVVNADAVERVLRTMRQRGFEYLVDVTAVHWPKRERPFDVIWILYSFADNRRVRVKTEVADGAELPSAVKFWEGANWLEREVFDMFGIRFSGHPELRRILLPEDWSGHPLRKEYGITQQDQNWVKLNLGIESGQ